MAKALKTQVNEASVSDFIAAIEDESKRKDCKALVKLMTEATGAKPKMWGSAIVGFGTYTYRYQSGTTGDWPLVGFSPRKTNLTLYIMAGFTGYSALMAKIGKHKTGKSCLYVKTLADLDMAVLRELVQQSVAYMRKKYS